MHVVDVLHPFLREGQRGVTLRRLPRELVSVDVGSPGVAVAAEADRLPDIAVARLKLDVRERVGVQYSVVCADQG